MRVLVVGNNLQAAADLSAELWDVERPVSDPDDETRYALAAITNGTLFGLQMPDGFVLKRHPSFNGLKPSTTRMVGVMSQAAANTLVGQATITMDSLASAASGAVLSEAAARAAGWIA